MNYQKFTPAAMLQPYVECYYIWEGQELPDQEFVVESPPNGFCSIVFNYGDPYYLQNSKYNRLEVPMQFVAGQSIYSYKLFFNGRIGLAGIVLKPAALATLFQLPAFEFTEERKDLLQLFPKQSIAPYLNKIHCAVSAEEKASILEQFLLNQVASRKPEPDYIDEAANLIIAHNGLLNVADLLKNSCMSRRTFERRFFQKVGLSPKYYARIRRIGYLCNLIAGKQKVNWRELFYKCEFYDQAHFIKDFEAFTGRTPQQYLQENKELAKYIAKPQQKSIPH